ncbi:MAG: ATP-binding cassette domain-containing protein [bacterium]|nr:ATP-binding cassette domain-containing protein [bacterium]
MENIFKVKNLNFSYENTKIIHNINIEMKENSINAVLGANDSGKTTLLRLIAGLLESNGEITLSNVCLTKSNSKQYYKLIGFSFYKDKKIKSKSLNYFLLKKLRNRGYKYKTSKKIIRSYSKMFEIDKLLNEKYNNLLQVNKVKFNIVYALISNPKMIILDDIFEYINFNEYSYISSLLRKAIKKLNFTVIYSTKKLDLCYFCDNVFFINKGKLELKESFNEIIKHDNILCRNGVIISTMLDISLKLQFYNLINDIEINPIEMVEKLWK